MSEEKKEPIIIGEKGKDGKDYCVSYATFYEKIKGYYGRERIVPTIMLLLAAKSVGIVEGDVLSNVKMEHQGEFLLDINGNIVYRKIKSEDYFSVDVEEYALCSKDPILKWKESKQMLAVFANMCIGGGLGLDIDVLGEPFVCFEGNLHLRFRDIWSEVFGLKSDLRNTYYKVCCDENMSHVKRLYKIQEEAKAYMKTYDKIQKKWQEITNLQKSNNIIL